MPAGEPIPVYGRGENIRDWLYVRITWRPARRVERGTPGETYNIAAITNVTNLDCANALRKILEHLSPPRDPANYAEPESRFVTDRPPRPALRDRRGSKIKRELGWQPQENPRPGFRKNRPVELNNPTCGKIILRRD